LFQSSLFGENRSIDQREIVFARYSCKSLRLIAILPRGSTGEAYYDEYLSTVKITRAQVKT